MKLVEAFEKILKTIYDHTGEAVDLTITGSF